MELCQMDALIPVNNHTEVKRDNCIGCGVCFNACTSGAISLKRKEKEQIPPKDSGEMYKRMIIERYGLFGALKIKSKAVLGKKI